MAAGWPVVGRLVRIAVAVVRLPEERDYLNNSPANRRMIAELNARQHTFETQQLPTLLSSLSDVNHRQMLSDTAKDNLVHSVPVALRRMTRDIAALRTRLDEVSAALNEQTRPTRAISGAEVINAGKLDAARGNVLRINLAFGGAALEGYVNVDRRAVPGVDIVAEIDALPLRPGEVDEITASGLLQHYSHDRLCNTILPHFHSLLKHGGKLRATVPDTQALTERYVKGECSHNEFRTAMLGRPDDSQQTHRNLFTPDHLRQILNEAGFKHVEILAAGPENNQRLELEVTAEK